MPHHAASPRRGFASDNFAGIHPVVLEAIVAANVGHAPVYGSDEYTASAITRCREHFGPDVEVAFVFNGTGANVLSLASAMQPHHAVICSEHAHIHLDECGAPERFTGGKLLPVPALDGKLTVEAVAAQLHGIGDQHHIQPRVVSVSQTTEYGTVYAPEELGRLAEYVHAHGLVLHMDGARLVNAAAALGCSLRALTGDVGVDVLSFGGTKHGLLLGEAIIFFDRALAVDVAFRRKQGMQLASKMRFIAAQFDALLTNDLWRRNARHANQMAARLGRGLADAGAHLTQPVQANAVFVRLSPAVVPTLRAAYDFHIWDECTGEVRLMTAFDSTEDDVDSFVALFRQAGGGT
jgi:threonine aldolase